MKHFFAFMLLSATLFSTSCDKEDNQLPPTIEVEKVTLNKNSLTLRLGETITLIAMVLPAEVENQAVTWTSNNEKVVSISNEGLVTAKESTHTPVLITATSVANPAKKAHCNVNVMDDRKPVYQISLNKSTLSLNIGESDTLIATISPDDAANKTVLWTTSDPEAVSVSNTGVVTANKAGTPVTITATSESNPTKTATCEVTVREPGSKICNYFYEDGSMSETLDSSKTCIGIVFWEDPDNAAHGLIVGLEERENIKTWDEALTWASSKTDGGLSWHCPNKEELQYLYCAYVGTAPTTWQDKTNMPEAVIDSAAATLFNDAITAAGGAPINTDTTAKYYWTSVEFDAKNAWYVNFKSAFIGTMNKTYVRVRPIAAF